MRDIDVDSHSTALEGRRIALGVTGGIAATESVRLCRELRRHGAEITVIMTTAATKVITTRGQGVDAPRGLHLFWLHPGWRHCFHWLRCPTHQNRCGSRITRQMAASGPTFDAAVGACRVT